MNRNGIAAERLAPDYHRRYKGCSAHIIGWHVTLLLMCRLTTDDRQALFHHMIVRITEKFVAETCCMFSFCRDVGDLLSHLGFHLPLSVVEDWRYKSQDVLWIDKTFPVVL
jgi:hypothetical protein